MRPIGGGAIQDEPVDTARSAPEDRVARAGLRPAPRTAGSVPPGTGLWVITDVAAYLQLSVNAVYKMTARKAAVRIPHIRLGGKLRFRQADIDRWLSLLTVSNLDILSKMRQKAAEVSHGNHSQTSSG